MEKNPIIHSSSLRKKMDIFLLKMKLITLLIFAVTLALSAKTYSQKTRIDLQVENSSLREILSTIEKSSELIFIYNENVLSTDVKKDINIKGESIEKVLELLFKGGDVSYRIDDRQVFLYKEERQKAKESVENPTAADQVQKKSISGSVKDSKGIGLPGVTVVVKGTTTGTVTDIDGNFTLSVPLDSKTLVFSFIGMKTQEMPLEEKTTVTVVMAGRVSVLRDV